MTRHSQFLTVAPCRTRLTNQALEGVAAAHLVALVDPVDELRVGRRPGEADRGRVDGFGLHVTWGDGGNLGGEEKTSVKV